MARIIKKKQYNQNKTQTKKRIKSIRKVKLQDKNLRSKRERERERGTYKVSEGFFSNS